MTGFLSICRQCAGAAGLVLLLAACSGRYSVEGEDGGDVFDAADREGLPDAADLPDSADADLEDADMDDPPDLIIDAPGDTADAAGDTGHEEEPPDPTASVPRIHPDDPHRFIRNGETWYPAGYYPGAAFNMTTPDYGGDYTLYNESFIDRIAENNINYFRIWINWGALSSGDTWDAHILPPYERTGPGTAADGGPRLDLDRFSEEYFAVIEHAVEYAADRDIVVQVMILDCWHAGFGRSYGFDELDFFAGPNNVSGVSFSSEAEWFDVGGTVYAHNIAFAQQVVARIGDNTNIVWETCNEKKPGDHSTPAATASDPFHAGIAEAIRAKESELGLPAHLVMPVDLPEHRTVAGHRTPTNGAPDQESIDAMHERMTGEQYSWNVILITDNDCCLGEPDAAFLRRKAWAALTAGAHIDAFNNELCYASVLASANTADGMRWIGATRSFVDDFGIDLAGMVPSDGLVSSGAWALARPGEEYIIYADAGTAQVTVEGLAGGHDAWWFDPRAGGTREAGAGPTFETPDGSDWVLYIKSGP
ncbi:MAG: cellulase family glycosylhydrolase [Pseudomonadota bacterium]